MAMQFFNFGNNETFHFFEWICAGKAGGPEALIDRAFKAAEKPGPDDWPEMDICYVVRDRLRDELQEILYNTEPDLDLNSRGSEIGVIWRDATGQPSDISLLHPIFALALYRIDCQAVAEALLIQAGKWTPCKEPPEFLPGRS
jgi:hypothetical protein